MKLAAKLLWIYKNILPGLLITIAMISIMTLLGEWLLRRSQPFNAVNWPAQFDESYGFNFIPGETVSWTKSFRFLGGD